MGLESGAASGWPGTDWIEDLVLRAAGPEIYTQWYEGKLSWADPAIRNAFQTYRSDVVANAYGGGRTAVATNFANAGDPLFANPPGCELLHQASFITGLGAFQSKEAGIDYNFFPFPAIDPRYAESVVGAGDLFGMFHDTPAARSLMRYLVTAEAPDIWVKIGGALSANKNATGYPDDISRRSAQILADAETFVFRRLRLDAHRHERPEATTTEGQRATEPVGLLGAVTSSVTDDEPHLPAAVAARMLREGYVKIDPGPLGRGLYAAADQIAHVAEGVVTLAVRGEQLVTSQ
jgi:hypothetical protein